MAEHTKHIRLLLLAALGLVPALASRGLSRDAGGPVLQQGQEGRWGSARSLPGSFAVHNLAVEASQLNLDEEVLAFTIGELGVDVDGNGASDDLVVFVDDLDALLASAPTPRGHLGAGILELGGRRLLWANPEEGVDGNGDGDGVDHLATLYEVDPASLTPLGWAVEISAFSSATDAGYRMEVGGATLYVEVDERDQGNRDLNGDGDALDTVVQILQVGARNPLKPLPAAQPGLKPAPLQLVRPSATSGFTLGVAPQKEDFGVIQLSEFSQSMDLNGDGDSFDVVPRYYDWLTGVPTVLPYDAVEFSASDEVLAFLVREFAQGLEDLNGDGDTLDLVAFVFERSTGQVTNLERAVLDARVQGTRVLLLRQELADGDLNGDGDAVDFVLSTHDVTSGVTTNLALALEPRDLAYAGAGDWTLVAVSEASQGNTDLNGDGDTLDQVLHRIDLASGVVTNLLTAVTNLTLAGERLIAVEVDERAQGGVDFNFDGDELDRVLGVFDTSLGTLVNTFLALDSLTPLAGDAGWLAFRVPEQAQGALDRNGDGDVWDRVLCVYDADLQAVRPTGLAVGRFVLEQGTIAAEVLESAQGGLDLNLDGDARDGVLHVLQPF